MSFAAEMKDFFSAFKAMKDTRSESDYRKAMADYYRGGKGGKGSLYGYGEDTSSKGSGGLFGKLGSMFGGDDEKDPYEGMSDLDVAAKKLKDAEGRALRAGDVPAVKKLQDDARDLRDRFGLGKKSGSGSGSKPAAIPEPDTNPSEGVNPNKSIIPSKKPLQGIFDDASAASDDAKKVAYLEEDPFGVEELGAPDEEKLDTVVRAATGGAIPEGDELDMGYDEESDPEEVEQDDDSDDMISDRMSELATPGVAAGLRYMSAQVQQPQSQQAIPEADMPAQDGTEAVARNVGAATPEEIAAFNKIIDPESKLPERARSAARIAAVWDMYGDKDPNKAERMINSLMLYDKKNSQTRGAVAMQAYQEGDLESATRLIADAWNEDIPSGVHIQPAVLQDGSVGAKIIKGGQVVDEKKLSAQEFGGLVQKVASGSAYLDNVLDMASRSDAARSARGAGRSSSVDASVLQDVILAKRALNRARATDDGSPESRKNLEAMQQRVDQIEEKAITYAMKQKNPAAILKSLGITAVPDSANAPRGTARTTSSRTGTGSSVKEREAAAEDAKDAKLQRFADNADSLEQAAIPVTPEGNAMDAGRMLLRDDKPGSQTRTITQPGFSANGSGVRSEGAAVEAARRTINPQRQAIEDRLAERGYDRAETVKSYADKGYGERTSGLEETYNAYLANTSPDKKPREVAPQERRTTIEMADRLARKNDVDPYRIFSFIDNATRDLTSPVRVDRKTGEVMYGGQRLKVDGETLAMIAKLRGENVQKATADRNKQWRSEADEYFQRRRDQMNREAPMPTPNYDAPGNPMP